MQNEILKPISYYKRNVILIFLFFSVQTTFGQYTIKNQDSSIQFPKNPIGVSAGFVYPTFFNNKSYGFFPSPGFEIGGFYRLNDVFNIDRNLRNTPYGLSNCESKSLSRLDIFFNSIQIHFGAQYRLFNYESDSLGGVVRSDNGIFDIGTVVPLFGIPEFRIVTALSPNYNFRTRFITRSQVDSINPSRPLTNQMSKRFNLGVKFALELQMRESIHLQFYYNGLLGVDRKNYFIHSAPSNFGVKILFELNTINHQEPIRFKMSDTLNVLKNDTLYILDRTCDNISRDKLFNLLSAYYTFSQFVILDDDEIAAVSKQPNTTFFALVGKYVASEFDPENVGIFLFDKDLNYLSRPFPHFTQYLAWDKCMTDDDALIRLIQNFNNRLIKASFANR